MERRGPNTWIVAVLAVTVGFLAALLIFGGKDNNNTSATVTDTTPTVAQTAATTTQEQSATPAATTTSTATTTVQPTTSTPQSTQPTIGGCIDLWNQTNNRADQTFLVNVATRQPIRVNVGSTSDVPPKCLITVVANNGDAYVFPEAAGQTYPYAQAPGATASSGIAAAQKISNALEQSDGTLKAR